MIYVHTNRKLLERFDTHIAIRSAVGITATMAAPQQEAEAVDYVYYQPNGGAGWVVPATQQGLYINVETQVANTNKNLVSGWDINPFGSNSLVWYTDPAVGTTHMRYPGDTTGNLAGNLVIGTIVGSSESFIPSSDIALFSFGAPAGRWRLNSPI